ncbi:MAG: DNA polymerase III subunit delta [Chloroflexota bacterium]
MFYLFHGDDEHSQKEMLADLKARLGDPALVELNSGRLEGQGLTLAQLRQVCDAVPFLGGKRLVMVYDLFAQPPNQALLDGLLAYLQHLPETTRLVFLESRPLPDKHPLLQFARSNPKIGYARLFKRPEQQELERWIRERVAERGGRISPRAVHVLAVNVGSDLNILTNEIEKLVLYKGEGETIEVEDVARLSPYAAEASVFELVDALGGRQLPLAAQLLRQKLDEGADPFFLFSMFVRQFRLLIQVKELAGEGARPAAVARELKLHEFVAQKLFQQSQNFTMPQLESLYAHLLECDVQVKGGRLEMPTALDLILTSL